MTREEQVLQDMSVSERYVDRELGNVSEEFMDGVDWADRHPEQLEKFFDEILEANKDVLKRLKEKGD